MQARIFRKFIGSTHALALKAQKAIRRFPADPIEHTIVLETNGINFVVWREHHSRKANTMMRSAVEPLNVVSFLRTMRETEYIGEPIPVILHPSCVCLKSFQTNTENPEKWLASHLAEVAPPGNRRELVMCYRTSTLNHLLVAFARRSFLSELTDMAQQSRISLKGIYAGGSLAADSLARQIEQHWEQSVDFSLCRYDISHDGDAMQIFPRPIASNIDISSAGSKTASLPSRQSIAAGQMPTLSPQSILLNTKGETIDFAPQIGLPKILSSHFVQRLVHAEFILILLLLGVLFLHWGVQTAGGNQLSDTEYRLAVGELTELRQLNNQAAKEVELAAGLQGPRYKTCNFLKSVAVATPPQIWLSSITYVIPTSGSACVFALNGFSLSGNEPLRFADSLRIVRDVRSVTLTKANIVEHPLPGMEHKSPPDRLTKFEITGEYEKE